MTAEEKLTIANLIAAIGEYKSAMTTNARAFGLDALELERQKIAMRRQSAEEALTEAMRKASLLTNV